MKTMVKTAGLLVLAAAGLLAGSELRFCLRADPKTFDPLAVSDEPSETIRYLTGGVLVRLNRQEQRLVGELAESWETSRDGRSIVFVLRKDVRFSDGSLFSADDVVHTLQRLMDPGLKSAIADSFQAGTPIARVSASGPHRVTVTFKNPAALGIERLFDEVAIVSRNNKEAVLGPFVKASYQPGVAVVLKRNIHYWKKDQSGRRLPYLEAVRLFIQPNREIELTRFLKGEVDLINNLDVLQFLRLSKQAPETVKDLGPSLEPELLFFNQAPTAPLPEYKRRWFQSTIFRKAVSRAINRADIARIVYQGHASPTAAAVSPANRQWHCRTIPREPYDPQGSLRALARDGFSLQNGVLRDNRGHPVELSIVTNAGNRARERTAALIQQDLRRIGIVVRVATLDFPALIERITRTYAYDVCLLGLVNTDLDPNGAINVWMSSGSAHQWNPNQPRPATAWEAEIDNLMREQATTRDFKKRKALYDRVQVILAEQAPFIYLVEENALVAVAARVRNIAPVSIRPQAYWNIENLSVAGVGGN